MPASSPATIDSTLRGDAGTGRVNAPAEWRWWLTGTTLGLLLFLSLTGLAVYLLPFSEFNQFSVLLHTAIGLLATPLLAWYLAVHWWRRFRGNFNHYQLLGYASALAVIVLWISGVVLTWQSIFGTRISPAWDTVHVVATFILVSTLAAHLLTLLVRAGNNPEVRRNLRSARRTCLIQTLSWSAVPTIACWLCAAFYEPVAFDESFPPAYSFKYGVDRPFAPSLARKDMTAIEQDLRRQIMLVLNEPQRQTFVQQLHPDPAEHVGIVSAARRICDVFPLDDAARACITDALQTAEQAFRTQGRIHPQQLAGSAGCGSSGCHSEILREWRPSAHRYASMDFVFQAVQTNMAEQLAPEATRYCAGCHDPISLFSGAKNVGNLTLSAEGADEGVSCLVCHSLVQTDVRGNADYTIALPPRYLFELHPGELAKGVSDFLIRAYPRQHIDSYSRPLYKTAEACGACHKQFVDDELNSLGWVQGQNQYDSWRKSRWHTEGDPARTIGCRECHMPLIQSDDPAAGDVSDPNRHAADGRHRGHRFLAANQFIPRRHNLPGADEHCDLTVKWLRGEYNIPEIADRWTAGPVVRLELVVPEQVHPGQQVRIQTILTNNKAGHDFPTGPMDMIEGWVEVTVSDQHDNIIFASARPDARGYLVDPQIVFKAELIDRQGDLIGRHELWDMVGARFKRALFPGFADTTDFFFECPLLSSDARTVLQPRAENTFDLPADLPAGQLRVGAKVWYCKFSAAFLDRLFGHDANVRSEVTDIAHAEAVIQVIPTQELGAQHAADEPPQG